MRWRGYRKSSNVEDRRGISGGKIAAGGGIGAIIVIVISLLTGKDLSGILQFFDSGVATEQTAGRPLDTSNTSDSTAQMVSAILAMTEDTWTTIFTQAGSQYRQPGLVMFENATSSGCGHAAAAMGPFYCPADQKVYIDLSFCRELRDRFQAPGNFAVAYVIAHEVGHHIQNLLGISDNVQRLRSRLSEVEYNRLSVKLELQADFLAGVWAHYANKQTSFLDPGDLESALTAANAIGDDKLQRESQGYVVPDAFTHGTSQQRMYWFKKGFDTGDLNQGQFDDIH